MSDAGGGFGVGGLEVTFDDSAAAQLPLSAILTSGRYRPTNFNNADFDPFAPGYCNPGPDEAGPQASCLTQAFRGTDPNGTWSLSVYDGGDGLSGELAHGWSLDITTDVTAPHTTITSGPTGTTTDPNPAFGFTSDDPAATYECSLDSGAFAACTSPRTFTGLGNGAHAFAVRATDTLGNLEATAATRTFTVTPAPDKVVSGSATATKKQKTKKAKVSVVVTAGEALTVATSGTIKVGTKTFALKKVSSAVAAGSTTLTLKLAKRGDATAIAKALSEDKTAKAAVTVVLTDAAGNTVTQKVTSKLHR